MGFGTWALILIAVAGLLALVSWFVYQRGAEGWSIAFAIGAILAMFAALFPAISYVDQRDCKAQAFVLGTQWHYSAYTGCQVRQGDRWVEIGDYEREKK